MSMLGKLSKIYDDTQKKAKLDAKNEVTSDVSKQSFDDSAAKLLLRKDELNISHVDETLKRDDAIVNKTDNPDVVDNVIQQD